METCESIDEYHIICFFNLLFALSGMTVFGIGTVIILRYYHYYMFLDKALWPIPMALITVGTVVVLIALYVWCSDAKRKTWKTLMTSTMLMLFFLTLTGVVFADYIQHPSFNRTLNHHFDQALYSYNNSKEVRIAWKTMQEELDCCGVNGTTDWRKFYDSGYLPDSCCGNNNRGGYEREKHQCMENINMVKEKKGCKDIFYQLMYKHAQLLDVLGLGIALVV